MFTRANDAASFGEPLRQFLQETFDVFKNTFCFFLGIFSANVHCVVSPCIFQNSKVTSCLSIKLLLLFAIREALPRRVFMHLPNLVFYFFNSRSPVSVSQRDAEFGPKYTQSYF